MATVPIEIVLQDAETPVDPTPTPESGEETNIIVPNTGTISDTEGISSSASIILPAIIAVLALGAIIALLIHRQQKRKRNNEAGISKKEKLATAASGTIAILAATVLVGNLVIPATNAATDDANDNEGTYLETEDKITITATIDKDSEEDTYIVSTKDILYATTDASGYTVTMSMIEGVLTSNLYLDGDETSEYYIAPVGVNENNTEEGTELSTNTWGYTLNEEAEEYLPVPLADTPATIKEGEEAATHEEIDVYYTVKVNKELLLGTYSGTIEYNIEGNYGFPDTLTTMQGMTHEICESVPTPGNKVTDPVPTATLEDIRDHKTYTIAKLADGNCWMTQNLDLDLKDNVALTPEDTDVSTNWTPMRSTINFTGTTVDGWQNDNFTPYSANPGDVYYYTTGTDADDTQYNSLAECEAVHDDGTCQHYHAGNYYNWSAAVASNDTSSMTARYENVSDSICPVGWRLPTGPNAEKINYSEMGNLVLSYDEILEKPIHEGCGGYCNYYYYLIDGFDNVRIAPLWLNRSGELTDGGSTLGIADLGNYWSATIKGRDGAFRLSFGHGSLDTANLDGNGSRGRGWGNPIRCLAK